MQYTFRLKEKYYFITYSNRKKLIGNGREVARKKEIMYLLRPYHVTAGIVLVELGFIFTKISGFIYRRHHATNLCTNRSE